MAATPVILIATTAPPEQPSGGLPQFDLPKWPGQMIWFLLIFGLVLLLMSRWFVPRIGGAIDQREDKIAGDIGQARKLKEEAEAQAAAAAEETRQARARAQKVAAEAKARVAAELHAQQAAEDAKLAESLAAADMAIRAARDAAMTNVRAIAADTAATIVEKLTGEAPGAKEVDAALAGRA
jgi:F-type H+-transporting ATPase subunit b